MNSWKKIIIIGGVIVVVVAAVIIIALKYEKPGPSKKTAIARTEIQTRAKRIWVDFSSNPDIANKRYTGKVIQFDGQITSVLANDSICQVVFAYKAGKNGDEGMRVYMLPEYCEQAKHINPFKPVKLKGICTGYNGRDVIFKDGSIAEPQK